MDYYDKQRAKVAIMFELVERGWKVYGYKEDESDSMTDYWSPSHWDGIATKNGYTLCVGISPYDVQTRSGKGITEQGYKLDYDKLNKLRALAEDDGATSDEKAAAWGRIEAMKQRVTDETKTVDAWPVFQMHPGRANWHIEKDGVILAQGIGAYSVRVSNSHMEENKKKQNDNVNAFIDKIEAVMGTNQQVTAHTVNVTKKVTRAQETQTGSLTAGQYIQLNANFSDGVVKGVFKCVRMIGDSGVFVRMNKKLSDTMSENTPGNRIMASVAWLDKYMSKQYIVWAELVEVDEVTTKTVYKTTQTETVQEDVQQIEGDTVQTDAPTGTSGNGVTVTYNTDKKGIEVKFAHKPAAGVIAMLKENGFRWSSRQGLWYAKDTDTRRVFVSALCETDDVQEQNHAVSKVTTVEDALGADVYASTQLPDNWAPEQVNMDEMADKMYTHLTQNGDLLSVLRNPTNDKETVWLHVEWTYLRHLAPDMWTMDNGRFDIDSLVAQYTDDVKRALFERLWDAYHPHTPEPTKRTRETSIVTHNKVIQFVPRDVRGVYAMLSDEQRGKFDTLMQVLGPDNMRELMRMHTNVDKLWSIVEDEIGKLGMERRRMEVR